jgi:hypothetical protein
VDSHHVELATELVVRRSTTHPPAGIRRGGSHAEGAVIGRSTCASVASPD